MSGGGIVTGAVLLLSAGPARGAAEPTDPHAVVRGMVVSCPGAGLEWGTDEMVRTMETLRGLGVNWIAIHPYGDIDDDGTVGRGPIDALYRAPSWLTRPIREAHRLGLKVCVTPHIAYWGSRFSWAGEIGFDDEASWRRFFATYEEWLLRVARLAGEADGFSVGTELDRTVHRETEWRRIIARVRSEVDAPLTYCSGWDTYREVPFWDALDAVGVQGYFPLVRHDRIPTDEELTAGWAAVVRELESFARERNRRVVLGELGYNRSLRAAVQPWEYEQDADPRAADLQRRCLDTALQSLSGSSEIAGAFLWKWFPGEAERGNFRQSAPELRAVIREHWGSAAPPSGGVSGPAAQRTP